MGKKILVVDDEPLVVKILEKRLKKEDYEVESCIDGKEAILYLSQKVPDLIILDLMMPHVDGMHVAEYLAANERTKRIPMIVYTVFDEESEQVKSVLSGAIGGHRVYLGKQVQAEILLEKIRSFIG